MLSHGGVDYEWCLASGWVKLQRVGAGKKMTKQWMPRRSGEAHTEDEALRMVTEFLGSSAVWAWTPKISFLQHVRKTKTVGHCLRVVRACESVYF